MNVKLVSSKSFRDNYKLPKNILISNNNKVKLNKKNNRLSCFYYNNNLNLKTTEKNNQINSLSPIINKGNNNIKLTNEFKNLINKKEKSNEPLILNENATINKKIKLLRAKSLSLMLFDNDIEDIQEFLNIKKDKNKDKDINYYNSNLFITSSAIASNKRNKTIKSKKSIKRNKTQTNFIKKYTPLEQIIKETERKLENVFKRKKSFLSSSTIFYKNNFLTNKKEKEKNIDFHFIKSDLEKKTLSIEKKQKISLTKIKEYSKYLKYFLEQNKLGVKIEKEINRFKNKHYLSAKNLIILKNFEKKEFKKNNDVNISGNINIKDFYKDRKIDSFSIAEFSRKMNKLNENVAFKYKNMIQEKMKLYFVNIYDKRRISKDKSMK